MILDSEIQSHKDELDELKEDAKKLKKLIVAAVNDGEEDLVVGLRQREKSLLKYIEDLVEELGGRDGRRDQKHFGSDEPRGSFCHTLLHSTIIDPEEDLADGGESDYSVSHDSWADREGPSPSGAEQAELDGPASGTKGHEDGPDLAEAK